MLPYVTHYISYYHNITKLLDITLQQYVFSFPPSHKAHPWMAGIRIAGDVSGQPGGLKIEYIPNEIAI
jgi:hypothetical protein